MKRKQEKETGVNEPELPNEVKLLQKELKKQQLHNNNNIGNLFVIDPTTNNEVKNFEYSVKKSFYQKHLKDWSTARITADTKNDWKKPDIEARAEKIAERAKQYWA